MRISYFLPDLFTYVSKFLLNAALLMNCTQTVLAIITYTSDISQILLVMSVFMLKCW